MKKKLSKVLTSLALCFAIGGLFTACKDGKPGEPGAQGEAGKSAYQLWLEQDGNAGKTVEEFLASLVGANGANGTDGANGSNGKSAYELWLAAGNEGTEADFLASLIGQKGDQGDKGDQGEDGKSAYEIWLEQGNEGTEEDFLVWLKGGCLHTNKVAWLTRDHVMKDGVVKAGFTIYHCTDCNLGVIEFESEIVHTFVDVNEPADCTNDGYSGQRCTVCGYVDGEVTDALGHTEGEWIVDEEATCAKVGSKHKECTVCHETLATEEIEKIPHTTAEYPITDTDKSVCTDGIDYITVCTVCGENLGIRNEAAIGHKVTSAWAVVAPTADTEGSLTSHCDNEDHDDVVVVLPKLNKDNYNYVENYYDASGKKVEYACQASSAEIVYTIYVNKDYVVTKNAEEAVQVEGAVAANSYSVSVALTPGIHKLNGEAYNASTVYNLDEVTGITQLDGKEATCSENGEGYFLCSDCGASIKVATTRNHTLDREHAIRTQEPTCEGTGVLTLTCTIPGCGETVTEVIPATGHSFAYASFQDAQGKWWARQTCNNGCGHDELIALAKEPEVMESATCQKEGKLLLTYVVDGEEKTLEATIGKTNHMLPTGALYKGETFNLDEVDFIHELTGEGIPEAKCNVDGQGYFICQYADCGASINVKTTRNHQYTGDPVIVEATCTSEGSSTQNCSECGQSVVTPIPMKAHELTYAIEENGSEGVVLVETCKNCDTVNERYPIDLKPVITPATCQKDGKAVYTYQPENAPAVEFTVILPKTNHMLPTGDLYDGEKFNLDKVDFIHELTGEGIPEAKCNVDGQGYFICQYDDCGASINVKTTRNHQYDDLTENVPATCTTAGHQTFTCTHCDATVTEYVKATGHTLVYEVTTLPTAAAVGSVKITCENCDYEETVELPVISAENGYTVVEAKDPTCQSMGRYEYTINVKVSYESQKVVDNDAADYTAEETITVTVKWTVPAGDHANDGEYTWTEEIEIDGQVYVVTKIGHLCGDCGKMIVISTSEPVLKTAA